MTGYEPLNTLKPVAEGLWLVDGPAIKSYGFPFSTRATVVRLENGDLWVHSPTQLTEGLRTELNAIGPVRHLISPNQKQFANVSHWQEAYPAATSWAAPGVAEQAIKQRVSLPDAQPLRWDQAEVPWQGQLHQMIIRGSTRHHEAVFFHMASRTLVLTDLVQAFETDKLPAQCRPYVWLCGIDDPNGKMPPAIRRTFKDKSAMGEDIETMVSWGARRVIIAHGRWYEANGTAELERAFKKILNARQWDRAIDEMKAREQD